MPDGGKLEEKTMKRVRRRAGKVEVSSSPGARNWGPRSKSKKRWWGNSRLFQERKKKHGVGAQRSSGGMIRVHEGATFEVRERSAASIKSSARRLQKLSGSDPSQKGLGRLHGRRGARHWRWNVEIPGMVRSKRT